MMRLLSLRLMKRRWTFGRSLSRSAPADRAESSLRMQALPFESPKLTAVSVGYMSGDDFASRLDLAIRRSDAAKRIEARAAEVKD
jgi:hypothetical protein